MRTLVFSSVGSLPESECRRIINGWARTAGGDRLNDIDVAVVCYHDAGFGSLAEEVDFFLRRPGLKYPNLHFFQQRTGILGAYDYVLVTDDDLALRGDEVARMAGVMAETGTAVASPSHRSDGKASPWPLMRARADGRLMASDFVEMGCVLFETAALLRFLTVYAGSDLTDFGIDFLISKVLYTSERPFLIFHDVAVSNPDRPWNRDVGLAAYQRLERGLSFWPRTWEYP